MCDAERWRDFRHAAAEALTVAGITNDAARLVMNLPMPPTLPPTDDGGAAMAEAVDALIGAAFDVGTLIGDKSRLLPVDGGRGAEARQAAARARVLAIHAAALARTEAAERECARLRVLAAPVWPDGAPGDGAS